MITFAPMPPLIATRSSSYRPLPALRRLLTIAALASLHALPSSVGYAQATLTQTDDAIPIPSGWLRLSVLNAWERYDSRFGESRTVGLGDPLSTDSLGPRQLPRLSPIEGGLQTLTNNPTQRLTFGRLEVRSDARIVTTPIALEYGITRRLSLGVVVPIVQTRASAQVLVNRRAAGDTTKTSNVGMWAESQRATQAALNKNVVDSLTKAATSLNGLLARCTQNPLAAECNTIRGKEVAAAEAARRANEVAGAVAVSYGVTSQDGGRRATRRQHAGEDDRERAGCAASAAGDLHPRDGARHPADGDDGVLVHRPAGPSERSGTAAKSVGRRPGLDRDDGAHRRRRHRGARARTAARARAARHAAASPVSVPSRSGGDRPLRDEAGRTRRGT
jgi:hypothetical protein